MMLLVHISKIFFAQVQLGSLKEPTPVQFTFETPGWYVLGSFLGIFFIISVVKSIIRYRKNKYRREALKILSALKKCWKSEMPVSELTPVLIQLKIVAGISYGKENVAQLYGAQWLAFLESKANKIRFEKSKDTIQQILYGNASEIIKREQANALLQTAQKWIKKHA